MTNKDSNLHGNTPLELVSIHGLHISRSHGVYSGIAIHICTLEIIFTSPTRMVTYLCGFSL